MKLKSVNDIIQNSTVILRMDLDLPIENGAILDNQRLVKSIPTIKLLLEKQCKIIVIGHRGRPVGKDETLSLKPVYTELMSLLDTNGESVFLESMDNIEIILETNKIVFIENLRFWKGESADAKAMADEGGYNFDYLKNLIEFSDAYVNDAFAVAHRPSPSIMLYKVMPGFYGLSFIEEAEKIGELLNNPEKPLTVVLGGAKEDKLKHLDELVKIADYVLIGGKLPRLRPTGYDGQSKILWAELREDGMDLSEEDIKKFSEIINNSKTIVWAGAMGKYEDDNCKKGTEEIAKSIANNPGYKIIAGGDTGASIANLGLNEKIDFICSGGGVTLEYLAKGTLPAWE